MSVAVRAAVLMACVACVMADDAVPKCDPAVTSRMAEFHPKGIPKNIIGSIQKNGLYSYKVVSSSEAKFLGMAVKCIGISMKDPPTAQVSYKVAVIPFGFSSTPTFKVPFRIEEKDGVLLQQGSKKYQLYVLYTSDTGVIFTYRCCDTCTGTAPNVGIAVADKLQNNKDTIAAFDAAKDKMKELGFDKDVLNMNACT